MVRKLVTIRKIDNIEPIKGADRIEKATLGGWNVVVGKNEYKTGEEVLFYEVDSYLPIKEPYLFLKDRCYKKLPNGTEGLRLKTIKLKKVVSQGLVMKLSHFPNIDFTDKKKDYAKELCVTLYEPPIPAQLSGTVKGSFPTHLVSKTDQERIQNLSDWFDKYKDVPFEKTLKYDGTSMTVIYHQESEEPFIMCSRNLMLEIEQENTYTKMNDKYKLKIKLEELGRNIAIQGEIIGEGVQKNNLNIKYQEFHVFDIYDIDKQTYLPSAERLTLCKQLGLQHVIVISNESYPFQLTMKDLIEDAYNAKYSDNKGEGFVYKSLTPVDGQLLSFKVINNKYLLEE